MLGKYLRPLVRWESALVVAIIAELIIFGSLNHRFIDPQRLLNSTTDFAYLGMLALPLAVIMLAGGIDISIGSMVSLSGIITGTLAGTEIRLALEGTGKDMQLVAMLTSEGVVLTGNGNGDIGKMIHWMDLTLIPTVSHARSL